MDILKTYLIQSPMIIATIALVAAAMLSSRKEKGGLLIVAGAIGLCFMTLVNPIFYSAVMPKLMENAAIDRFENIYMAVGLVTNIIWGGSIGLVAYGTFMRVSRTQQP